MSDLIIIQARVSSTRLSGKVLRDFYDGESILDIQLKKLKELDIPFVLATTTNVADDKLIHWANENNVDVFRGSEANVLARFIECAKQYKADHLIRVCSDNPFIQLSQIQHYLKSIESGLDYISYCNSEGIPAIRTHWGLFAEGVSLVALEKAQSLLEYHPEKAFYSEHVTNFIYGHPDVFRVKLEMAPESIAKRNDLRFTIDTEDDFRNMSELLELMKSTEKGLDEIIEATDNNPLFLERMQKGIQSFSK